ncbi:uncharacterized protein LOC128997797 [Macrosteles quadrilineatus]|uniref:uncharacterized protein LOC128997797 n=1 Tax=Macrosteles quadrilineatus TaxID=74068 RepID=UPI0023E1E92D|nr:uncharacterized protein LOC128997797 [Macrosteles quadrilineatus]
MDMSFMFFTISVRFLAYYKIMAAVFENILDITPKPDIGKKIADFLEENGISPVHALLYLSGSILILNFIFTVQPIAINAIIMCKNHKYQLPKLSGDSADIEAGILLNHGTSPPLFFSAPTPRKTLQDPSPDLLQHRLLQEPAKVHFEDEVPQRKVHKPDPPIKGMFQSPLN